MGRSDLSASLPLQVLQIIKASYNYVYILYVYILYMYMYIQLMGSLHCFRRLLFILSNCSMDPAAGGT